MGSSWSKSKLCKFSCYTVALGGILMYYLLSLLPILLQIFINICVSPNYNFALFVIHFVWILFGLPIYLLFVNLHYCKIKKIKYLISYINMPLILILITHRYYNKRNSRFLYYYKFCIRIIRKMS